MKNGGGLPKNITSVFVSSDRNTILAFYRVRPRHRIVDCVELETWLEDGRFIYSTNNPGFHGLRHPDCLVVNPIKSKKLPSMIQEHGRFVRENARGGFRPYLSLGVVIEGMIMQRDSRIEIDKGKEFSLDEDEAIRMAPASRHEKIRKIYKRLREIRKESG